MAASWSKLKDIITTSITTGKMITAAWLDAVAENDDWFRTYHDHSGDAGDGGSVAGTYLDADETVLNYSNDSTEKTIVSFTVPANTLGTKDWVMLRVPCAFKDNAASGGATIRLKYGSTTVLTATVVDYGAGADWRPTEITAYLRGDGSTSAQEGWMGLYSGRDGTSDGDVFGDYNGTAAEDSTSALALTLTWQFSAADPGLEFYSVGAILFGAYAS